MEEVYIMSIARTPIGSLGGVISSVSAPQLGATAMKAAMERAKINPDQIEEVLMGNVISANVGQAPAQQASIFAGIPTSVPCTTINKVCASGMKAIMFGAQSILLGMNDIVIAGGMESMSNVPYYLDKARSGYRLGHGQVIDGKEYGITREDQDAFAVESYKRAAKAYETGAFKEELVAVEVMNGKEKVL